jgi:hypothetical protein
MSKPKLQIIVLFQNLGDSEAYFARSPAPPLAGALVAGLTPDLIEVELLPEMVRSIDYSTDADFIALSFMDYCAPHAYEVAKRFKTLGKTVVAGGKYTSTFPEEVFPHMDSVVVGEAEKVWPRVVEDLVNGKLKRIYEAPFAPPLDNIPPPRYDLVESEGRIVDRDLSHYEGDHLVFKPKRVTSEDVFSAFRHINEYFYSRKSILKRWLRFVLKQNKGRNVFRRIFRGVLLSMIFLRLSIFQRDHAQKRVYPMISKDSGEDISLFQKIKKGTVTFFLG